MNIIALHRNAVIGLAMVVSGCVSVSHNVDASEMDGCYVIDGGARLALRNGGLFAPQGTSPLAVAQYRLLPSGAFIWTAPEVLMAPNGSLSRQSSASHRLVPLQRETFWPIRTRVRLLFPKNDGFGFQILHKDPNLSC